VKITPRLDYERLADALVDRGLANREAIRLVLDQANTTGGVFPEILVRENLVTDWEVSRVAAEVFNLPFLPVDVTPPNADLLADLDADYLRAHALVPVERFADVLTVSMPAVVPTAVLNALPTNKETVVLPVVGLVSSNRAWLEEHAQVAEAPPAALVAEGELEGGGWADIFDAGDEAVQLGLDPDDVPPPVPGERNRKIVLDESDFS
jgi:hypothetical protein